MQLDRIDNSSHFSNFIIPSKFGAGLKIYNLYVPSASCYTTPISWLDQCCTDRTAPNILGFHKIATAASLLCQPSIPFNKVAHSIINSQYGIIPNIYMLASLETWNGCSTLLLEASFASS